MTEHRYFAAANTGCGFISRFSEIFDPEKFDTVYIIKGGPGTGKSTFMKKLGAEAESLGYKPEYYYCSSDIKSLDGLIIRELSTCVLDGTAPHVTEARFPGAREIILNFGDAFDISALRKDRREIERLIKENSEQYVRVYAALRAAREFFSERIRVCEKSYMREKAESFIARLLSNMDKGEASEASLCTVCGEGEVRMSAYADAAEKIILAGAFYGFEYLLLSDIEAHARRRGLCARFSRSPICPDVAESVYFEKNGVYIAAERKDDVEYSKLINARRFANADALRSERGYLRLLQKLETDALSCAVNSMKRAGEIHDELEKYYISATNFSVIDGIYERIKNGIFANRI